MLELLRALWGNLWLRLLPRVGARVRHLGRAGLEHRPKGLGIDLVHWLPALPRGSGRLTQREDQPKMWPPRGRVSNLDCLDTVSQLGRDHEEVDDYAGPHLGTLPAYPAQ